MAKQNLSAKQVGAGAKQENKVVNTNPGFIFRTLNKRAQGRDKEAKEVEGFSRENLKELFNRLNNTFAGGGFWWSSVYAVNGRLVTSLSLVKDPAKYGELTNVSPFAWSYESYIPGAENHVLIEFAGNLYLATLATQWSENGVIDAAKARLSLVEQYSAAIDKEQEQERKEQEKEIRKAERKAERKRKSAERKEQKEQAQELAKVVQELKEQVANGTISQEQAAAKVQELLAA